MILGILSIYGIIKGRRKIILPTEGTIKLKPNLLITVIPTIFIMCFLFLIVSAVLALMQSGIGSVGTGPKLILSVLCVPLLMLAYSNITQYLNHRLHFDDKEIRIKKHNKETVQIKWSEIIHVERCFSYLRPTQVIELRTKTNNHRIDITMIGFKVFEEYLKKYNPNAGDLLQWKLYHHPTGAIL